MFTLVDPLPKLLSAEEFLATFQTPDYVIEGVVQRGRLYACTSITGHGKTAVWLYLACMVASGRTFAELEISPGAVIILAGENPDDLCGRLHACCQEFLFRGAALPIYVLPANFPLTAENAELLKQQIDALQIVPAMIIVDTAAAFFPGDDDNHNVQMGAYGRQLRILTTCEGAPAVVALSHPIKNADREHLLPRGGGAFLNELDGNLTIWSEALGESSTLHWQGKLRGADFAPLNFTLRDVKVQALKDAKERPFVSIIAQPQTAEAAAQIAEQATTDENAVLYWLRTSPGISLAQIASASGWENEKGQPLKAKVQRALKSLKNDRLARVYRGKWRITQAGKDELDGKNDP